MAHHVPYLSHDWLSCTGVTPEIKQQAQYIGERGKYWVMIPDLYRGKIGVNAEEAKHVRALLPPPFSTSTVSSVDIRGMSGRYTILPQPSRVAACVQFDEAVHYPL